MTHYLKSHITVNKNIVALFCIIPIWEMKILKNVYIG